MNRCPTAPPALLARRLMLWAVACAALTAGASWAQGTAYSGRNFPDAARRATFAVVAAPEITLDGKPDRLSPGARIRGTNNLLVMTGGIVGQEFPVRFVRDAAGLVHEVWLLTPEEAAHRRPSDPAPRSFFGFSLS